MWIWSPEARRGGGGWAADVDLVAGGEAGRGGEAAAVVAGAVAGLVVQGPRGAVAGETGVDAGDLVVGLEADVGVRGTADGDRVGLVRHHPALLAEQQHEFGFHSHPSRLHPARGHGARSGSAPLVGAILPFNRNSRPPTI